jgi:hypothetical protein
VRFEEERPGTRHSIVTTASSTRCSCRTGPTSVCRCSTSPT